MIINFKEIPEANTANGDQDTWELFAREFLKSIGFTIARDPDRGADGGKDLIAIEKRHGLVGETQIKWLVSCKHYAHSGHAVGTNDEQSISDRIQQFECDGFMGFYSTLASSGLNDRLQNIQHSTIFDHEKIERFLLENVNASQLIARFFPESWRIMMENNPSNYLGDYVPLECEVCGKDLLPNNGVLAFCHDIETDEIIDVYCACHGQCDQILEIRHKNTITSWDEISDLTIPKYYLWRMTGCMNDLRKGKIRYSDAAYKKRLEYFEIIGQRVFRNQTEVETELYDRFMEIQI